MRHLVLLSILAAGCLPGSLRGDALLTVDPADGFLNLFPGWVLWVSLANLTFGNLLMIYICMMGAFKRKRYALVAWALLNPLY